MKFDAEDKYFAAGNLSNCLASGDGGVRVYNTISGKMLVGFTNKLADKDQAMPATGVRWRPVTGVRTHTIVTFVSSDGSVSQYQMPSGKCVYNKIPVYRNELYCIDYEPEGDYFAVGGKNGRVYIIDDETKKITNDMHEGLKYISGHANRIFSCKFDANDRNCLVTGGWDRALYVHDLRTNGPVASIYGPLISGDSIDMLNGLILAGSHRGKEPLQVFDLGMRKMIYNIDWEISGSYFDSAFLYGARFLTDNSDVVIAGGSGGQVKMFEHSEDD
jgi:COMPASS component SWD3